MKKQTAVEWLYSELSKNNISNDSIKSRIYKESEILKQAKAMEKEQIQDAFYFGIEVDESKVHSPYKAAEDYFKQTYE
jgi:3-mercaptopyruvate sulfurtransferase SseA